MPEMWSDELAAKLYAYSKKYRESDEYKTHLVWNRVGKKIEDLIFDELILLAHTENPTIEIDMSTLLALINEGI